MKMMKVRNVKAPQRANPHDAGIDFYVPYDFQGVRLKHGEAVLIPSGIKVDVPEGYALIMTNKSGVASKKNLDVMACVIDAGYQGEVHINLINNGAKDVIIEPGDKIVQGILFPVVCCNITMVDELWTEKSARGEGGFGSTGS